MYAGFSQGRGLSGGTKGAGRDSNGVADVVVCEAVDAAQTVFVVKRWGPVLVNY
jgi:hypothetical protein